MKSPNSVTNSCHVIAHHQESMLVIGSRIVDVCRNTSVGNVVIATVDKLAPGLGIAFVSWTHDTSLDRRTHGILPLHNWRGRGPLQNNHTSARLGDCILVQIIEEGKHPKVDLVSGHIVLITSRLVAWPGPSKQTGLFSKNLSTKIDLHFRGFGGYMVPNGVSGTGPRRWVREKYTVETHWEKHILQFINHSNRVPNLTKVSQSGVNSIFTRWFTTPVFPWILVLDLDLRESIARCLIRHIPNFDRHIEITALDPWKNWLSLHRAAIFQPKVPLRSGGTLIIELTEIGWTLDINSGMALAIGSKRRANQQALSAIAQQILIRSMKGLILIDFIPDISIEKLRINLVQLTSLVQEDRYHTRIISISGSGLVRLVRPRLAHHSTAS